MYKIYLFVLFSFLYCHCSGQDLSQVEGNNKVKKYKCNVEVLFEIANESYEKKEYCASSVLFKKYLELENSKFFIENPLFKQSIVDAVTFCMVECENSRIVELEYLNEIAELRAENEFLKMVNRPRYHDEMKVGSPAPD